MNRRKFLKLLGGLLAVLHPITVGITPFVKWPISKQLDGDEYIVFFNMSDEQVAEAKAKWQKALETQERGFFYRILTE